MCSIKIFLEKQASRQQFEITCSLDWLVGWFLFPFLFKLMKAERGGGRGGGVQRKYLCLLCIHIKIVEQSIDRSIFFLFLFFVMLQVSSPRRNVG